MKRERVEPSPIDEHREASVLKPFLRCVFFFAVALVTAGAAFGQDWFRISTGLGVEKPRVAVADFAPRGDSAKGHSSLFTQVVRDDLVFS